MENRFKIPKDEPDDNPDIELPADIIEKAALAHKLLTYEFVKKGAPMMVAIVAAQTIVQDALEETVAIEEAARERYRAAVIINYN